MTVAYSTPADAVLVAIDIAKVRNEVLIEATGQKRRRRLSVLNSRTEHDRLIDVLRAYGLSVVCGFEATGNYHRLIAWRLAEAGFEVRLVSSLALARTREALHNSWDKNDPKDAQVILHMLRIQATQVYHDPLRAGINDVQELSKTHEAIAKAKTEIQHRILTHSCRCIFPRSSASGAARQDRSVAIVADLFKLWEKELPRISGKSKLAEAIRYATSRRAVLERFLTDGRVEIDSNIVERAIRPQTIVRKNALFAGSDGGGNTWATVATLLQTAKMNNVDPLAWLTQTLERIADRWPISQIDQLMPWNYSS